jgi:drug/metabolite transporter (DMT)-like permease
MSSAQSHRRAIVMLIITGVLWSSSGLFIKMLDWQPLAILSARSLVSLLVLVGYVRQVPRRWSRWQWVGAVGFVGAQLLFITATKLTTAANAIFLQYTLPLYVVILAYWFLGERPQRADWVTLPLILIGLLLFFGDGLNWDSVLGNVIAILSGISMAVMMVALRREKEGNPTQTLLLGTILSALIGLPFLAQEQFTFTSVGMALYLGLFQIGLPSVLYSTAMKSVPALEATLIVTLEPILNPMWVFLVIGEAPSPLALMGGLVVLGAIALRALVGARAAPTLA